MDVIAASAEEEEEPVEKADDETYHGCKEAVRYGLSCLTSGALRMCGQMRICY